MKKRWFVLPLVVVLIVALLLAGLLAYAAPSKELTMDYTPIKLEDKLLEMMSNLNTELVLTEADVNALIKSHMNKQINEQITIQGADFKLQDNRLYAELNVLLNNRFAAEMHASYAISWNDPQLTLQPIELKLKDIKLPTSWLEEISFPLYDKEETLIGIDRLNTRGNELVIKLRLQLF